MGFGGRHRFPTLYVTKKLQTKSGLIFKNCPHFRALRDDDTDKNKLSDEEGKSKNRRMTLKKLDKHVEKMDERMLKKRLREKGGNRPPNVKALREHLKKIIKYHRKQVNEEIPSIYPILGPANEDSDSGKENDWEEEKRKHTKEELKFGIKRK